MHTIDCRYGELHAPVNYMSLCLLKNVFGVKIRLLTIAAEF